MCSICLPVLTDFAIVHTESHCPLRTSSYCSYCADYGHLTKACPSRPSRRFTEPMYLEQLIPASELREFQITSTTPFTGNIKEEPQQLLEIEDNDRIIGAYLEARSIKIQKKSTKKLSLRYTLEEYAKLRQMRVVYVK